MPRGLLAACISLDVSFRCPPSRRAPSPAPALPYAPCSAAKLKQEQAALRAEAELERMERRKKELERQLGRSASQQGSRP